MMTSGKTLRGAAATAALLALFAFSAPAFAQTSTDTNPPASDTMKKPAHHKKHHGHHKSGHQMSKSTGGATSKSSSQPQPQPQGGGSKGY